jgi:hypothetical protein
MAENEDQIKKQNEGLKSTQDSLEAINKAAQERAAFESSIADDLALENDLMRDLLKVENQRNKEGLRRVDQQRELTKTFGQQLNIARSIRNITASEMGTAELQKKLAKDRLEVNKNLHFLQKAALQTYSENADINLDIQNSIKAQADAAKELIKELDKASKVSKEIEEHFGLGIFNTLKNTINLIPGLNKIAPGFEKAADAYRKVLVLQKMGGGAFGIGDKKGQKIKGLGIDQAEDLNNRIKALRAGDKSAASGMSKDFIKDLPKEIQDTVKGKTGAAALSILSKQFANGVATAVTPLTAAFTALQNFLKNFILIQFVNAMLKADKTAGNLAKSFNVTYKEAIGIQDKLNSIANLSGNVFVTTQKLAESQMAINALYGTTAMATEEQLTTMTELREVAGFTNEELQGVLRISFATGKEMKKITGEVIAQAKYTSLQYGVSLNEREIVKEISKVSAATTLSLGKNPGLIGKAISTAKALGMELSKVEGIASSLLNFESSIEDELSAELLLGKELNLEAARYYALTNNIAGVAEEIASQIGTAADFMGMNYLQQNALAKAVGMNREELAQTLYVQEQLAGLTGEEAKRKEDILNKRIAEVGLAQAMQEMEEGGYETLEAQASVQDRIVATTEKLNELFASMSPLILTIADAIMLVVEPISWLVGMVSEIGKMFGGWAGILLGAIPIIKNLSLIMRATKIYGIQGAIAAIFRSFSSIPFGIGIPLAIAAVAGLGTMIAGVSSKADDMMSFPTAGAGYGDRILVDRAAGTQTALNNSDTISATKAGASPSQSSPVVKLYLDNEEIANSQMKGMSRI